MNFPFKKCLHKNKLLVLSCQRTYVYTFLSAYDVLSGQELWQIIQSFWARTYILYCFKCPPVYIYSCSSLLYFLHLLLFMLTSSMHIKTLCISELFIVAKIFTQYYNKDIWSTCNVSDVTQIQSQKLYILSNKYARNYLHVIRLTLALMHMHVKALIMRRTILSNKFMVSMVLIVHRTSLSVPYFIPVSGLWGYL